MDKVDDSDQIISSASVYDFSEIILMQPNN